MRPDAYDDFVKHINFTDPDNIAKQIGAGQVVDFPMEPSKVQVLDIGAGTGVMGKLLKEKGFTDIVAIDPSQTLLDKAE